MTAHARFQLVESSGEISEPITKFGGQPVWVAAPCWPYDPLTSQQMRFLGQIALPEATFPDSTSGMVYVVYLFFGTESEPLYNEAFAAVIQIAGAVHLSGGSGVVFGSDRRPGKVDRTGEHCRLG